MRIGPYELLERIGVGGMAEVFRARQTGADGFERYVAIKRILPGIAADHDFVEMFIDEAKIAVQLSHPNIAQIYDLGMEDGVYFIAQEYIHGRDMGAIVERQRAAGVPLPIPLVVHIGMKVCEALQHAHTAVGPGGQPLQIIHRDVSPSNVLVSYEGAVKVIDFGLAKAQGRLSTTQVGVVKGKLAYLSPEQARGRPIDSRSDLFSLGTCLFEWLTGQRLFLRKNDVDTVMAIQRAEIPPVRALRPDVPPALQAIVLRALAPDPDRRYQTALEMAEELLSFSYEHRMTARRAALGDYVRALFPEDFAEPWPDAPEARPRRDTVPSASALDIEALPTADIDLLAPAGDTARPARPSGGDHEIEAAQLEEDGTLAAADAPELSALEILEAVEELDEDDELEPTMTTPSGAGTRELLPDAGVRFDDATADFARESADLAQRMGSFEDTTAPGGERARAVLAGETGFDEDEPTKSISEEALREALREARVPRELRGAPDEAAALASDGAEDEFDFTDATNVEPVAGDDTNPEIDLGET